MPHPARCDRPCRSTGRWQVKHIPFSPTPERGFFRHPAPANTAPYPSSGPRRPLYLPDHTPAILPARKPGKRPGRRGKPTRGDRKIVRPSRTAGSGIRPPLTEPGNIAFHFFLTTFDLTNGQKAFVIFAPLENCDLSCSWSNERNVLMAGLTSRHELCCMGSCLRREPLRLFRTGLSQAFMGVSDNGLTLFSSFSRRRDRAGQHLPPCPPPKPPLT